MHNAVLSCIQTYDVCKTVLKLAGSFLPRYSDIKCFSCDSVYSVFMSAGLISNEVWSARNENWSSDAVCHPDRCLHPCHQGYRLRCYCSVLNIACVKIIIGVIPSSHVIETLQCCVKLLVEWQQGHLSVNIITELSCLDRLLCEWVWLRVTVCLW